MLQQQTTPNLSGFRGQRFISCLYCMHHGSIAAVGGGGGGGSEFGERFCHHSHSRGPR